MPGRPSLLSINELNEGAEKPWRRPKQSSWGRNLRNLHTVSKAPVEGKSACEVDSPFRNRSVEENLRLFEEMQAGKHPEGSLLLRAKIDMNHPNMNMRDPPMQLAMHWKSSHAG